MPGLVPGIRDFLVQSKKDVDGRDKPGHDQGARMAPIMPTSRTIPALIDEQAARFGAREALVGGDERYTYAALRENVRAFAKGLHALGVRKGDHVAILMGNQPAWVIADLAICALGAVMVAVNTWVTARELC